MSLLLLLARSASTSAPAPPAESDAIECWVTSPTGAFIAYLDRSKASPFRSFAFSIELNKPGAGSLEYYETNALVAAHPTVFDFGNLAWMRYRGVTKTWIVEQRVMKLDESEAASGWYQVAGRGVLQLLGDRLIWPTGFDGTNQPKDWLLPMPSGTYAHRVNLLGPGSYWRLGETSGVMVDSGTLFNDGTVVGGPLRGVDGLLAGDANDAVYLDGTQYVDAGDVFDFSGTDPINVDIPWHSFSVEAWVRPDSSPASGHRAIVSKSDGSPNGWELRHSKDSVSFRRGSDVVEGPALPMGKTTHLLATFDGRDLVLYVNAVAQEPVRSDVILPGTGQPLRIGMRSSETTGGFVGTIDEVAVYEATTLSDTDAAGHYAVGRAKALHNQFRTFVQRPAGFMLWDLIVESNPRFPTQIGIGIIGGDPDGNDLWNQQFRFDNLLDVLTAATDLGDVWMDGLTFNYPGGLIGTDRSTSVIFEEGADLMRLERDQNDRDSASWIVAEGVGEGMAARVRIAERFGDVRRRESYLDAKDARNGKQLQRYADRELVLQGLQHSIGLDVAETRYRALTDYAVGDDVGVIAPSRGLNTSLRIVAMTLAEDGERVRVSIDVNTQRTERMLAIDARQRFLARQFETRQRQPQGGSSFKAFDGSDVFDDTNTMEVMWAVPDKVDQVDECLVTIHFRQYHHQDATGVHVESYPSTHSVRVRLYKNAVLLSTVTVTRDDEDLDLSDDVDGPGKYKLVLDSNSGQPNSGRLAADLSGHVLASIGRS